MENVPSTGPIVYLIIGVFWLRFKAAVKLTPQTFPELEGAFNVCMGVFLFLELGIVVRELIEQNGDGHAVEDDAEGNAAKCHTATQIGDRDDVSIAHSGDTHLQEIRYYYKMQ